MIKLITFTDHRMTISAQKCAQSAMNCGADSYSIWIPGDLSEHFKMLQSDLLKQERGYGFWCWKPFIVNEEVMKAADRDIIVYCDAGNEWVGDMRQIVEIMDQDLFLFSNGWSHLDWCKMDCLKEVLNPEGAHIGVTGSYVETLLDWKQVQASTFFIRVTPASRKFIKEWYAWSIMPGMIDNEPSILQNIPTFAEHRHDQAILCCLQIKHGYNLHWFPSTTAAHLRSEYPNDKYPVMLFHHRKRNAEW